MKANDQRSIIEELLGISRLSEKAERLKELMRDTNEDIKTEQARLEQVKISNEKMEETIRKFQIKNIAWEESQQVRNYLFLNFISCLIKLFSSILFGVRNIPFYSF